MAEHKEITVNAKPREGRGKNDARRARVAGMVPVVGLWRRRRQRVSACAFARSGGNSAVGVGP